jgi:DNA invertase Pin-like site-specific DNA recombinase
MIYGYARVSTDRQSVEAQVRQLRAAGARKVFREVASAAKTDRAQLRRLLAELSVGDVLMVTRLDRLARSTPRSFEHPCGDRREKGRLPLARRHMGRLMLTVLGSLAEFERDLIRAHRRRTRSRQGARRQARPQTEIARTPEARGDPPARPSGRARARDRAQLQREPRHDFATHGMTSPSRKRPLSLGTQWPRYIEVRAR